MSDGKLRNEPVDAVPSSPGMITHSLDDDTVNVHGGTDADLRSRTLNIGEPNRFERLLWGGCRAVTVGAKRQI